MQEDLPPFETMKPRLREVTGLLPEAAEVVTGRARVGTPSAGLQTSGLHGLLGEPEK